MSDAKRKVLDMVEQGKISSDEGDALLSAMKDEKKFSFRTLFDPYDRIGVVSSIAVGVVVAVASAVVAMYFDVRYDGFLDLHTGEGDVDLLAAVNDQLVAWPVSALILWLIALPFARKARFVDFLGALGVARVLQLIAGLALPPPPADVLERMATDPVSAIGEMTGMIPMILVAVILIGWFIATLVFAFRHASGLRGGKLAGAFVLALFVAETVSKIVLHFVP